MPEGTRRYSTIFYLKISVQKVSKCAEGYSTVSNGTLPEGVVQKCLESTIWYTTVLNCTLLEAAD